MMPQVESHKCHTFSWVDQWLTWHAFGPRSTVPDPTSSTLPGPTRSTVPSHVRWRWASGATTCSATCTICGAKCRSFRCCFACFWWWAVTNTWAAARAGTGTCELWPESAAWHHEIEPIASPGGSCDTWFEQGAIFLLSWWSLCWWFLNWFWLVSTFFAEAKEPQYSPGLYQECVRHAGRLHLGLCWLQSVPVQLFPWGPQDPNICTHNMCARC